MTGRTSRIAGGFVTTLGALAVVLVQAFARWGPTDARSDNGGTQVPPASLRVVGISDDDTITVIDEGGRTPRQIKVRLDGIDAPRRGRSSGQRPRRRSRRWSMAAP
ncbi:hypothetical protein BH23VER1_BH23VER1_27070 [soil metagenome]